MPLLQLIIAYVQSTQTCIGYPLLIYSDIGLQHTMHFPY